MQKYLIILFFIVFAQSNYGQNAPVANNDAYTGFVNTTLNEAAPGILTNDTDADGDTLTVTEFLFNSNTYAAGSTVNFAQGTITISADGSFTFVPAMDYVGSIPEISYNISDGTSTGTATLNITITQPPTPPVANDDDYTSFVNVTLNEAAPGILGNDTDINNDNLTVTSFTINGTTFSAGDTATSSQGNITINSDGSFTFIPNNGFVGTVDVVNYTISDGTATSSANLNINVIYPPTPPVANDDDYTSFVNVTLNETAPGILGNDTDINNDNLTVTSFTINGTTFSAGDTASLSQGNITINFDGSFTFIPNNGFVGTVDVVNYTISDGTATSSANLNINIIYPPTPPVANDDYDTADINTTLNVAAPGVLVNDTDLNNDALAVNEFLINGISYNAGQTVPLAQGIFTLNADGSYSLIPTPNFTGELPIITYSITDGGFTALANLFISVEPTQDLLELNLFSSCNQGFTANNEYKIRYTAVFTNRSNAKDYHEPSFIRNLDLVDNLQAAFGNGCVIRVDEMNVYNNDFTRDYINGGGMPREFNNDAINPNFGTVTSNNFFTANARNSLILYPRQNITVIFCVTVDPFCNGRPNPTPSGSGIDFNNTINVSSNRGSVSESVLLTDFHTTEAVVTAGLYVPEFNDDLDPPGVINPNGTYDYNNRVIITNEGSATANNVNFNMGLGSFLDNSIVFDEIRISQVSGPPVTINPNYDGNTETNLLLPNNSLAAGEKVILELFYLIQPYTSNIYNYFYQLDFSQTQGALDGIDESTAANRRRHSFVTWSDNLGDHLDRYYRTASSTESVSSSLQCDCRRSSMRFLYTSSSTVNNIISNVDTEPDGILEHEEITFEITITNTSESVEIRNLQIENNLENICSGNIVEVKTPVISSSTAVANPNLNPNFNGNSDINLFDGASGILGANESITIQLPVVLSEDCFGTNVVSFISSDPFRGLITTSSVNVSAFTDTDNDGVRNSIDLDDDNDTIPDTLESNGLDPLVDDDADLIPNYRDTDFGADANGDGVVDIFDFDNDGVANHLDLDSDNDGILDIVEAGNITSDTNTNGRTNIAVGSNGLDNSLETNDTATATINYTLPNSDADANLNFLDIDSDNDGIVDNIEAQATDNYISPNNTYSDSGIDTAYLTGLSPVDTENDAIFDYLDTNSDNDIRDDIIEGWDTNSDGTPETIPLNIDSDNDGLDDAFDNDDNLVNPTNNQTPQSFPNVDDVDTPERDWREIIAIVILIDDVSSAEGTIFDFGIRLVTKRDNTVLVESASPITINFNSVNGTNTTDVFDVATAPFDFDAVTNTVLTIPPLTNTTSFSVTTLEDPIYEIDELFTLNGNITSNNTITQNIGAIATILDNDNPPDIVLSDARANEGENLVHTITISNPSSRPITVEVLSRRNEAISPDDYLNLREEVTIDGTIDPNNANTEVSVSITTVTDNINEKDEEILDVIGILKTFIVGSQDLNKTGFIIDINPNPIIQVNDVKVVEGEDLIFDIALVDSSGEAMLNYQPINVILSTSDVTTTANFDYESFSVLTEIPAFNTNITRVIKSIDDKLNESTETFSFRVETNLANISNSSTPNAIGTILDNDFPNLFSPNNDGKSDVFKIAGLDDYPNFSIVIYNRAGNVVFSYNNNGNNSPVWWDGTNKGTQVPVGVYFYTLHFNDGVREPFKSFVQLIR